MGLILPGMVAPKMMRNRGQCVTCQMLSFEIRLEKAKSDYEQCIDLWGPFDADAAAEYRQMGKASETYARMERNVRANTSNVEGWEVVKK